MNGLTSIIFLDIKLGTMSNIKVHILYWFNNKLTIDQENKPIYLNGIIKSMLLRKETTRLEFEKKKLVSFQKLVKMIIRFK